MSQTGTSSENADSIPRSFKTVYGFYDECKRRCNIKIWKTFIDVFNCLPIAAVVASKIFCVHGGLSPSLSSMDDIRRISRPTDVPDYGLLNDLLWSDPSDTALDWEDNERGVSYCFGKTVISAFLARYDFDLICRAHMVVEGESASDVQGDLAVPDIPSLRRLRILERADPGHNLFGAVSFRPVRRDVWLLTSVLHGIPRTSSYSLLDSTTEITWASLTTLLPP